MSEVAGNDKLICKDAERTQHSTEHSILLQDDREKRKSESDTPEELMHFLAMIDENGQSMTDLNNPSPVKSLTVKETKCNNKSASLPVTSKGKKKNGTKRVQQIDINQLFKGEFTEETLYFALKGIRLDCLQETEKRIKQLNERFNISDPKNITGIVNLTGMDLIDIDIPMIVQRAFLSEKKKCTGIILRNNNITSNGIRMLVDALLCIKPKLQYLSLSNNPNIGDTGVEHLIRLLVGSQWMSFLALPQTSLTDCSVRLLADVLCNNTTRSSSSVTKLYISNNKDITDSSLEALLQIVEKNKTLKIFAIQECSLSEEVQLQLKLAVPQTKKRKFLLLL